jgi:hypothetical protein
VTNDDKDIKRKERGSAVAHEKWCARCSDDPGLAAPAYRAACSTFTRPLRNSFQWQRDEVHPCSRLRRGTPRGLGHREVMVETWGGMQRSTRFAILEARHRIIVRVQTPPGDVSYAPWLTVFPKVPVLKSPSVSCQFPFLLAVEVSPFGGRESASSYYKCCVVKHHEYYLRLGTSPWSTTEVEKGTRRAQMYRSHDHKCDEAGAPTH